MLHARLLPHPSRSCEHVRSLTVDLDWTSAKALLLHYVLEGEIGRLRLPGEGSGARTDGLWQHTCFEVFLKAHASPGYAELNFATSGAWAAYRFGDYRQDRRDIAPMAPPHIVCRRTAAQLHVEVSCNVQDIEPAATGRLHLALAAVIEEDTGGRSYWALQHAAGQPDFHAPACFALTLERRGG